MTASSPYHFTRIVRHLTLTGSQAGRTLCGAARTGNDWHAVYAPLHIQKHREEVCNACISEYIASFDGDETPPEWAK